MVGSTYSKHDSTAITWRQWWMWGHKQFSDAREWHGTTHFDHWRHRRAFPREFVRFLTERLGRQIDGNRSFRGWKARKSITAQTRKSITLRLWYGRGSLSLRLCYGRRGSLSLRRRGSLSLRLWYGRGSLSLRRRGKACWGRAVLYARKSITAAMIWTMHQWTIFFDI